MEIKKVCITIARINGLENDAYYCENRHMYAWDIFFSEVSNLLIDDLTGKYILNNLTGMYLSKDSKEEADKKLNKIKYNFNMGKIYNGEKVAILFNEYNRRILAISSLGSELWIDLKEEFRLVPFKELNIISTGLKVF